MFLFIKTDFRIRVRSALLSYIIKYGAIAQPRSLIDGESLDAQLAPPCRHGLLWPQLKAPDGVPGVSEAIKLLLVVVVDALDNLERWLGRLARINPIGAKGHWGIRNWLGSQVIQKTG